MRRIVALLALVGLVIISRAVDVGPAPGAEPTFVAGLVLLVGFLAGIVAQKLRLPRISGYLATGLLLGPHALAVISSPVMDQLHFLNELAVAFIALAAGAEMEFSTLRARARLILRLSLSCTAFACVGVGLVVFASGPLLFPFTSGFSTVQLVAVALLIGVLATARSPSSAVAVIRECDAHGPFTESVLGVTVAIDVLVIMLFAVALSTCEVLLRPGAELDTAFVSSVFTELALGIAVGALIGAALAFYTSRWSSNLALLLLGTALVVTEIAHGTAAYMQSTHGLPLRLEPLLICVTAGLVARNIGGHGVRFVHAIEGVSLPVFVLFFSLAGAGLDLDALRSTGLAALLLVAVRAATQFAGGWVGAWWAGDDVERRPLYGLTQLAQAGVSIGLTLEVVRRFPEWGPAFATLIVAAISLNQIIGPVAMSFALRRAGEARSGSS